MLNRNFNNMHCPKCNGNIFFENEGCDRYDKRADNWTGWCLQCGYTLYIKNGVMLNRGMNNLMLEKETMLRER